MAANVDRDLTPVLQRRKAAALPYARRNDGQVIGEARRNLVPQFSALIAIAVVTADERVVVFKQSASLAGRVCSTSLPPAATMPWMLGLTSRRVLFGLIGSLYLVAFPYHPGLRSPNELCRLWQTRALVEYGSLDINQALRDYGPVGDLSVKDGRYFPSKAPLLSFGAVPIYWALRAWGGGGRFAVPEVPLVFWSRLFITVLPTLVMLIFLRRFLGTYLSGGWADVAVAAYAVGSLAFGYSLLFISHQTTSVLLFGCFYSLWRCGRGEWKPSGYAVAGAFAGAAMACEYTSALTLAPLVVYGAMELLRAEAAGWRSRFARLKQPLFLATLGAAPFIVALMLYHQACFGGPFQTGYKYLNDPGYQGWHVGGFLGIRLPEPRVFALSFFSPLRGLFVLSPFLLLAMPGLAMLWKAANRSAAAVDQTEVKAPPRSLFWLSALELLAHAYFTSSFSYESWGWTTGPRHMTPLVPYLLIPAAWVLQSLSRQALAASQLGLAASIGLCLSSMAMTGLVGLVNYIPDSVSTSMFGLVWPLYRDGYLPPTTLAFLGIPNPWSGAVAIALLGGIVLVTLFKSLEEAMGPSAVFPTASGRRSIYGLMASAVMLIHFGLVRAATRGDAADLAAQAHLRSVWLAPPHQRVTFWPRL